MLESLHEQILLPEQRQFDALINKHPALSSWTLCKVQHKQHSYPIKACRLGSDKPDAPVLALIGGVHGLERIGSQVALAFLETLVERLDWDQSLASGLENLKLLFIPMVNPVGIHHATRANGNGVDLMRNAPVNADSAVPFLVGGHRVSPHLPWYRGQQYQPMEIESQQLCDTIAKELTQSPFTILIDFHSGFGFHDRLWFPMACSQQPPEHLAEYFALHQLIQRTYPHLDYVFEPQSKHYLSHGDIWDHVYRNHLSKNTGTTFLPLTLEMGSWNWVKKNPRQLSSFFGLFNPVKPHRIQRALRRHTILLEFLIRAVRSYQHWQPHNNQRAELIQHAHQLWYQ